MSCECRQTRFRLVAELEALIADGEPPPSHVVRDSETSYEAELEALLDDGSNEPFDSTDPQQHETSARPLLRRGSRGNAVRVLQRLLANAGFSPGRVDGIFGRRTRSAVIAFQRSRRLAVDGIVGPQTWGALGSSGGGAPAGPATATSSTNTWVLPADVLAAGNAQYVRYESPGAWKGTSGCTGGLTPGAQELRRHILASFRGVRSIGGYNCRQNTASRSQTSVHGVGRALDIMIPRVGGRANSSVGDPIANWLVRNAAAIGVQYIIWNRTRWSGSRSPRRARYTGPNPHTDHIHAELTNAAANRRTPWFTRSDTGDQSRETMLDEIMGDEVWGSIPRSRTDELGVIGLELEVNRRSREYIRWVQRSLNRILGTRLAVDGIAGSKTRSTVRLFQRRKGLTVDGIVGPNTEGALIQAGADLPSGSQVIRFEPEKISGAIVLDRFVFNSDAVQSFHRPIIQRIAAAVVSGQSSARPIRTVRLIGHTDSAGANEFNRDLGRRRAKSVQRAILSEIDRQQPGLSSRIRMTIDTHGESQPRTDNATSAGRARNRRVEVGLVRSTKPPPRRPPTPRTHTAVLDVVAKSFIQPISHLGLIVCPPAPISAQGKLVVLAAATRAAFQEDPKTDAKNRKYRLYSRVGFTAKCRGDELLSVRPSSPVKDVGLECIPKTGVCLLPPPLQMTSVRIRRLDRKTIEFSWRGRGRPHNLAEVSFQAVCSRTSRFIWHEVKGRIECRNGLARVTKVVLTGSRFPSHRLFVNGILRAKLRQGPFSNLWVSSRRRRDEVR